MAGYADLTGRHFGELTVINATSERTNKGVVIWQCQCSCGNYKKASTEYLHRSKKPSCGCMALKGWEESGRKRMVDLTGKKFGFLTVISAVEGRTNGSTHWQCECKCGQSIIVSSRYLMDGSNHSCGCYHGYKFNRKQRYEAITGNPLLEGNTLVFLDGNNNNWEIDNLYQIRKSIYLKMARRQWFSDSPEQTLTAIKICELELAIKSKEQSL